MILTILWFGCGVIAVGMENYYRRMTYPAMYIEDYWEAKENNNRPAYDSYDFLFYLVALCFGPISLAIGGYLNSSKYGLSYRFTKWTQEEAKVLFPNDHKAKMW